MVRSRGSTLAATDRMTVVVARPTEPNNLNLNPTDSAWPSRALATALPLLKEVSLMEQYNEELKAHLMATDQQFRTLAEEHSRFHKQLEEIEAKAHLTLEDEAEEIRLKKQKLRLKDEMNALLARHRAQQVA
jgi:uncharacterized protein YdcH (DUF465 family)